MNFHPFTYYSGIAINSNYGSVRSLILTVHTLQLGPDKTLSTTPLEPMTTTIQDILNQRKERPR